jgi:hypothetical protein
MRTLLILQLFLDSDDPGALRGMLRSLDGYRTVTFPDEAHLLEVLHCWTENSQPPAPKPPPPPEARFK